MSTDQCAQNPDGSLKDPKDIQWFHDKDDALPLPSAAAPAQPLGHGLRNKAANQFLDAVAHEQLGSDDEDLNAFARPPRCKCAPCASNIPGGAAPPTLSSRNLFETLLVDESSDDEKDENFQSVSGSGSKSSDDSGDNSTGLELISNNEVRVALFS
jgi:hypothetical protein